MREILKNPIITKDSVIYDCIYFGNYPQSDETGRKKDPIKWRVLSVDENDAFLVADTNLDVQQYNEVKEYVPWEICTIRSWLNGYGSSSNVCRTDYSNNNFIDSAFTTAEQNAIKTVKVVNADDPRYETAAGNDLKDKIFLLSYYDVTNPHYGFSSDHVVENEARRRKNTAYVAKGGTTGKNWMNREGNTDCWWIRSLSNSGGTSFVMHSGYIYQSGFDAYNHYKAVCPALHLNLKSEYWKYAETNII